MGLSVQEQELAKRLNLQFPPKGLPVEAEIAFRNNVIDRQVDGVFSDAKNRAAYYDNRLMVPSEAELQYRSSGANPLAEGLAKQPPNPTPPNQPPLTNPAPRTSAATLPPTPRTSGLGTGNGMQSAPTTASPRSPLNPSTRPGAIPGGLPSPAGGLLLPGVGGAINFGSRIIAGQPIGQAAFGAAGTFGGTVVGGVIGSAFGPVGTFVGGMVGGFLGGLASDLIYNAAFPPTTEPGRFSQDPKTGPLPFEGGQSPVNYRVRGMQTVIYDDRVGGIKQAIAHTYNTAIPDKTGSTQRWLLGPIQGIDPTYKIGGGSSFGLPLAVRHSLGDGTFRTTYLNVSSSNPDPGFYNYSPNTVVNPQIIAVERVDGQPDTGGNVPRLAIPTDSRLPESIAHPGNNAYAPRSAQVPPLVSPQGRVESAAVTPAPNNYAPGGTASKSNGTPSKPLIPVGVPANSPHPSNSPLPIAGLPSVAAPGSPSSTGAPASSPVAVPNKSPFTFNPDGSYQIVTPGSPLGTANPQTNLDDVTYPKEGYQPLILKANPIVATPFPSSNFSSSPSPDTAVPSGIPQTKAAPITPDAFKETPTAPPPTPAPDLSEQFQKEIEKLRKQQEDQLIPVMLLLTGLTAALAPIASNTTPQALQTAAAAGTCQTLQPGGCMAPLANNAAAAANNSAVNNTLLGSILAFLQTLQAAFMAPILAGVNLINTKLGPLMAGANGIGGFLGRLSSSLGVDRALNLIAIAANLHNAMMLSANLKITLLEMLSSIGNATGLLQTSEGENVDLNQVFNAGIETVLIRILGVDSYAGLKVGLRKYNAIYQAASNSLNAVSSMFNSLGNVVEQGAEYTGKIGNSLKGAGLVVENAYSWMSEKFDAKSSKFIKFQSTIGNVTQVLETVNEIAETVVEGQQSAIEFQKANTEFIKAVEDAQKNPGIENKAVKDEAARAKEAATKDPTGEIDTGLLSFLSN